MKLGKLSFGLVIAILAIGVSFAANASKFGKRTITACYQVVTLQNSTGATTYTPAQNTAKATVQAQVFGLSQIKYLKELPTIINEECVPELTRFCCATFTEDLSAPATVPSITINGVTAKWVVQELRFRQ